MSRYVKNGETKSIYDLRKMYPNSMIPDDGDMSWDGWEKLQPSSIPKALPNYRVDEGIPDGNKQTWLQVPLTANEVASLYECVLNAHLDNIAQSDRWTNRFTFVARAAYPNAWQEKAKAFGTWMDKCNMHMYFLIEQILADELIALTEEEFIASLPGFDE